MIIEIRIKRPDPLTKQDIDAMLFKLVYRGGVSAGVNLQKLWVMREGDERDYHQIFSRVDARDEQVHVSR